MARLAHHQHWAKKIDRKTNWPWGEPFGKKNVKGVFSAPQKPRPRRSGRPEKTNFETALPLAVGCGIDRGPRVEPGRRRSGGRQRKRKEPPSQFGPRPAFQPGRGRFGPVNQLIPPLRPVSPGSGRARPPTPEAPAGLPIPTSAATLQGEPCPLPLCRGRSAGRSRPASARRPLPTTLRRESSAVGKRPSRLAALHATPRFSEPPRSAVVAAFSPSRAMAAAEAASSPAEAPHGKTGRPGRASLGRITAPRSGCPAASEIGRLAACLNRKVSS